MRVGCSSNFYVLECTSYIVLSCTRVLALAIVTVFKNSFFISAPSEKKKTEKEREMYMYVANDSNICNLVKSLSNIAYLHLFHS